MDLKAFMVSGLGEKNAIKYAASPDFKDADGNPLEWEIAPLRPEQVDEIRRDCTKRVPIPGKRGAFTKDVDIDSMSLKMAVAATTFPNLNDAALQDFYKVKCGEDLLNKLLYTPAVRDQYIAKVQVACGYDQEFSDLTVQAKN